MNRVMPVSTTILFISGFLGGLLGGLPSAAQDFSGAFLTVNPQGGQTVVRLVQSGEDVTGTMSTQGEVFQIAGLLEDGTLAGTMMLNQQDGLWFEAQLDDDDLIVTLIAPGVDGQPDYTSATTYLFSKTASGAIDQSEQDPEPNMGADPESAPAAQAPPDRPAGIHDGTPKSIEWANFLANKKATQMESYSSGSAGGYSSRTDYHLCSNGRFFMTDENSVSIDTGGASGYGGGSGSAAGTWRVISQGQINGIELRYDNGEVSQARLEYDNQDGATYIDGSRWYITPTDQCGY